MTVSSQVGESAPPQRLAADADSFRVFYADSLPRVYGYLLRRCGGSVAVAEDLTQETFLAAVAELRKGRSIEAPMPWVLGIARHNLLDHYRRQARSERSCAMQSANSRSLRVTAASGCATARARLCCGFPLRSGRHSC